MMTDEADGEVSRLQSALRDARDMLLRWERDPNMPGPSCIRGRLDAAIAEMREDPSAKVLWLCGKWRGRDDCGHPAWELQGVFETREAAVAACREPCDFVGPVTLNSEAPQAATEWAGCTYPLAQ